VGGFFFYEKHDLRAMSKLWLKYTADVRNDTMAWKYAGDSYATKAGDKPWISEMYGYSFGAAKANVSHIWDEDSMMYPGYVPNGGWCGGGGVWVVVVCGCGWVEGWRGVGWGCVRGGVGGGAC
jgi:hypothetical protein